MKFSAVATTILSLVLVDPATSFVLPTTGASTCSSSSSSSTTTTLRVSSQSTNVVPPKKVADLAT
eukprot:CAMPEP_0113472592 /NCGR_PEP_ID=MMETSP0014_2-20120614/17596_1 /TAXON_ID=2857 /ORGANISM="Nitzschia sp." /LENGTH=64 /DNA_ID=CAMNT_0000365309 /DNA_START=96 /DNA_END=286 /DNA_ORIENTATION=+ /assembly_acc=CAM_ASM_000159